MSKVFHRKVFPVSLPASSVFTLYACSHWLVFGQHKFYFSPLDWQKYSILYVIFYMNLYKWWGCHNSSTAFLYVCICTVCICFWAVLVFSPVFAVCTHIYLGMCIVVSQRKCGVYKWYFICMYCILCIVYYVLCIVYCIM